MRLAQGRQSPDKPQVAQPLPREAGDPPLDPNRGEPCSAERPGVPYKTREFSPLCLRWHLGLSWKAGGQKVFSWCQQR